MQFRRELLYFASGFCLALLIVLAWRYVIPPRTSLPASSSRAPAVTHTPEPPAEPSPGLQVSRPTQGSPFVARERHDPPPDRQRGTWSDRQAIVPSRPDLASGHEQDAEVPHATAAEPEHESLRSAVQNILQHKIDEDQHLRAVLHDAAKAYLEQRKE